MKTAIKLGLLGNGIQRSQAKYLHELLGEMTGLNVTYRAMDLSANPQPFIKAELQRCQDEGFRGVNVTHPYKRDAFNAVQTHHEFPPGLTSVNTVLFEDNQWLAHNTDYSGFCRAFHQQFGTGATPGKVLMLGAGGVGLAIAHGLNTLHTDELFLYDMQTELAVELQQQLAGNRMPVTVLDNTTDIVPVMQSATGLINATPLGMFQYPGSAFPEAGFKTQQWAFDAVYTPENTEFLQACRRRNIETLSGFKLFFYQGLDAFRHFTGMDVDPAIAEAEFLKRHPSELSGTL